MPFASITVNSTSDVANGTDGLCTLREAITAANNDVASGAPAGECLAGSGDDTITISASGTINLTGNLPNIVGNVNLNGPGSALLTLRRDTGGDYRIITVGPGLVGISGLTVTNGKTADGTTGGLTGGAGVSGGGIHNAGTLTLSDIVVTSNSTGAGGAGLNTGGSGGFGGGIENTGTLIMTNCTVTGNSTGKGGSGNSSVGDGGSGAGIHSSGLPQGLGTLTMTDCVVSGNTAGDAGDTIGIAGRGGAGAGIFSRSAILTLTRVTVSNNVAGNSLASTGNNAFGGSGGGIFTILGLASLTNCTVSGNQTGTTNGGTNGYGGGINNECPTTIIDSTISGNTGNDGSAILNRRALTITNSTISGNQTFDDSGAGINNSDSSSSLNLTNCTITQNDGLGVNAGVSATARNTIIAGNGSSFSDVGGNFSTQGNNLIGKGDGSGFINGTNGDLVGSAASPIDPRLGPLANNGGPTQTHSLLAGSSAIDAGHNCVLTDTCSPALGFSLTTDQRGAGSIRNADAADADTTQTVDIGAFEAQASVEDITNKSTPKDTPLSFGFNVGDAGLITSVAASSSNTTLVPNLPANINATGSGSVRTLNITPAANQTGTSTITVTVTSGSESMSDTFVLTVTEPDVSVAVSPSAVDEDGATNLVYTFTRTGGTSSSLTVNFSVGGDASSSTDYALSGTESFVAPNGTITFGAGNSTTMVTLNPSFDTTEEGNETAILTVAAGSGYNVVSPSQATGTITNDDTDVTLAVSPSSVAEDGTTNLVYTFTRTGVTSGALTVNFSVGGTAAFSTDYTQTGATTFGASSGTVTFAVGNSTATVTVDPSPDLAFEGNETVILTVTPGTGYNVGSPSAETGTITNDDPATLVVNSTDDAADISIGDALCDTDAGTAGNQCTLRAAIQEVNFVAIGTDVINFSLPGNSTITLNTELPAISGNLNINGPGPNLLTVMRSTAGGTPAFRIFRIQSGTVNLSGLTISGGSVNSPNFGGGVSNGATLTLDNMTVNGNAAGFGGGGIYNTGTLIVNNSTISGNTSAGSGGGMLIEGGTVTLNNSIVSGNNGGSGGGILNQNGILTLTDSTVSNNTGTSGGGIYNTFGGATLTLTNCTVSNNVSSSFAGGIFTNYNLTMTNTTVSSNTAHDFGGGIRNNGGFLRLTNSSVSKNKSNTSSGGGISNGGFQAYLGNTIVADNTSALGGPDLDGSFTSEDYNLVGNTLGATFTGTTTHNIVNQNANLGPLANNGGPTFTHALLAGSPALDAGSNAISDAAGLTTDQRGTEFIRKADSADADTNQMVDIGAFEAQASVEDIPAKATLEDTPLSFSFNVGDSAMITSVTASSSNTTLVPNLPANINVTGSGSTRNLNITPAANLFGTSTITVTVTSGSESMSDTFLLTVTEVPDVTIAVAPTSVAEDGATNLVYTFTRTGATSSSLIVDFSVAGDAVFGTDYTQTGAATFGTTSGTVTFGAGNSTTTVTIDPGSDPTIEGNETAILTVTAGTGYDVASPSAATGTITNDDTDVTVTVLPSSESEDGATNLVYTFTRTDAISGALTVNFSVGGDATFGTDYTQTGAATFGASSGTVAFAAGNSIATVTIDPAVDSTLEPDETIILIVTPGTGYNVASPSQATGTITNDDTAPTFAINDVTHNEGDAGTTSYTFTVTKTGSTALNATVGYATGAGTATAPSDFTAIETTTLTFLPADTTKQFTVLVNGDTSVESDEVFTAHLSNPGNATISDADGTGTITNDDTDVTLAVAPASVSEDGTTNLVYTFTRTGVSSGALTVNFSVAGDATPGTDYTQTGAATFGASSGTVAFGAGDSTATITVDPSPDVAFESNETVILTVTSGTGYNIGSPSQATGTITNDDPVGGIIRFSSATYNTTESSGFTTITVERTGDATQAVTVDYATPDDSEATTVVECSTINGTASPRCDFTTALGTLRFAAGETSKTFKVLISQDRFVEGDETMVLTLSNLTGGAVFGVPTTATLTIADDASEPATNPIDDAANFVRQHYLDFLNREPDAAGLAFWTNQITSCGVDAQCIEVRRIHVSASFFLSIEFQDTGYLVERLYKASYGDAVGNSTIGGAHTLPVPIVKFSEFLPDTQKLSQGVIVGQPGWELVLDNNKQAFVAEFVQRTRFATAYPTTLSPEAFVDAMFTNAGVTPTPADRQAAIDEFGGAVNTTNLAARGRALRKVAENSTLTTNEVNRAFVLMQFFGYLRRNPNAAQDTDHSGYDFWLTKLNLFNGNFIKAEMVKAFLSSIEYRHRFGP